MPLSLTEHWNAVKHNLVDITNNGTKQQSLASLSNCVDLKNSRNRRKWASKRLIYYNNSAATFCLLLNCGDVEVNPGPQSVRPCKPRKSRHAPRCIQCEKVVARNHKRCICSNCFDFRHVKCTQEFNPKFVSASIPKEWVCPKCIGSVLPFYAHDLSDDISNKSENEVTHDIHLQALTDREQLLGTVC